MGNKRYRVMLAIFCIAFVGISACQPQEREEPSANTSPLQTVTSAVVPTSSSLPTVTQAATPNADEIHASIIDALLALNNKSNRMDVTTVSGDGKTATNVIEFIPPDRKHIISIEENVEYIVIGEKVYAKTGTSGKWEATQIPSSAFLGEGEVTAEMIDEMISEVQWMRWDEIEGKAVQVYGYISTTNSSDIELHSQTELWVGVEDGLPYKMVIDGEILSVSTDPTTGESHSAAVKALTTTVIDFDDGIRIEPPIE